MVIIAFLAVVCWADTCAFADNWRAQRALANNDIETAQQLWSSVLAKSPEDVSALHGLANVAYVQERYQDCLHLLETVIQQAGEQQKARALMDRAACYAKLNQLESAEQDLDAVLKSTPTNKKAAHNKRVIQLERKVREQQKTPQQQKDTKDKNQQNQQSPKSGDKQSQQSQSSQKQEPGSEEQQESEQKSSEQGQQQSHNGSGQPQDSQGSQQPLPKPAAPAEALREGREQGTGQRQPQSSTDQQQDGQQQEQESGKQERGSRRRKAQDAANKREQEKQRKAVQGTSVPDERLSGEQQQLLAQIAADEQEMQKYAIAHQAAQVGNEEQGTRW